MEKKLEEQFVTFDISETLKNLNFDEPCFAYFSPSLKKNINHELHLGSVENLKSLDAVKIYDFYNKYSYLAPLWQQAIDFFRTIHKLHIELPIGGHPDKYYVFVGEYIYSNHNEIAEFDYYDARKEAVLKCIEIVKKKNTEKYNTGNLLQKTEFDINRKDFYKVDEPITRTKKRLTQLHKMNMEEVSYGQFGIPGIMSGLYIETVWNYSDELWDKYISWVKDLVKEKSK